MKKSILVLSLVALLGLNILALGTSTSVKSTVMLASGKTLITLQATYGGMWPTSPPLAFFVTAVSDGLTTSEYITWAGSQRFIERDQRPGRGRGCPVYGPNGQPDHRIRLG